jgi:hypothetical protein
MLGPRVDRLGSANASGVAGIVVAVELVEVVALEVHGMCPRSFGLVPKVDGVGKKCGVLAVSIDDEVDTGKVAVGAA